MPIVALMGLNTGEKVGIGFGLAVMGLIVGLLWTKSTGGGVKHYMHIGNTDVAIRSDLLGVASRHGQEHAATLPWQFDRSQAPQCIQDLTHPDHPMYQVTLLLNGVGTYHLFMENPGCGDCMLYVLALYLCLYGRDGAPPEIAALREILVRYIRMHADNAAFRLRDTLADWMVAENILPRRHMTYAEVDHQLAPQHTGHGPGPSFADMGVALTFIHLKAFACAYNIKIRVWKHGADHPLGTLIPAGDLLPDHALTEDDVAAPFCNVFVAHTSEGAHIMLLGELITR